MKARAVAFLPLLLAACAVGDGRGAAKGQIYYKNCTGTGADDDLGTPQMLHDFDLRPNFFGGEPIEDIKPRGNGNRLVVRMMDAGRRVEDNDLLVFDIDIWRVAQCVRGVPEVLATEPLKRFCAYLPGKTAPRLRVGPEYPIRASLSLRKTCPGSFYSNNNVNIAWVAGARGVTLGVTENAPPEQWDSWIELRQFGTAGVLPGDPTKREDVDPSFRLEYGDQLFAEAFHLNLVDARVLHEEAEVEKVPRPIEDPDVFGFVDGFFDFELQRGAGAQTFP